MSAVFFFCLLFCSTWRFEAELGLHQLVTQQQQQQDEVANGSQVSLSSPFADAAPPSFSPDQQQQSAGGAPSFGKSDVSELQLPQVNVLDIEQSVTLDTPRAAAAAIQGSSAAGRGTVSASRAKLVRELLNKSELASLDSFRFCVLLTT